jgi:hypothetical protein
MFSAVAEVRASPPLFPVFSRSFFLFLKHGYEEIIGGGASDAAFPAFRAGSNCE